MYNYGEKWEKVGNHKIKMIGNYKNKLDEKARLSIPSKLRKKLGDLIVISYGFDNTLEIRTKKNFNEWSSSLIAEGNFKKDARMLQRLILGNSFELSLDKAGRILIPKALLEMTKIKKEIVLVGIGDKVEIHSKEQWDSYSNNSDNLAASMEALSEKLANS